MSLFPRPRKRRLRRRSRGSRTLWFTAMRVSGMLSRGTTEHTTMPPRLILPTAGQANSWHGNFDDRRDRRGWVWVSQTLYLVRGGSQNDQKSGNGAVHSDLPQAA